MSEDRQTVFISAILLAAGQATRMGELKQLLPFRGKTLVEWALAPLLHPAVSEVIAVVGYRAEEVQKILAAYPVKIVLNEQFVEGMGSSIQRGLQEISPRARAVLIGLADQPGISTEVVTMLIAAFGSTEKRIIIPVSAGRRGHPVLFDLSLKAEMLAASKEVGLRQVLRARPEEILEVPVEGEGILLDVDTPEEYRRLLQPPQT